MNPDSEDQIRRIRELHRVVERLAGAPLPPDLDNHLNAANSAAHSDDPVSPALAHLVPEEGRRDWLAQVRRYVGDSLEALALAHYHVERVREIEQEIRSAFEQPQCAMPSTSVGFGSRRLHAEYHAFLHASRGSLEYVAAAVGSTFKTDCNRIKKVADAIERQAPGPDAQRVAAVLRAELAELPRILSYDGQMSNRDKIAHAVFVHSGTFNVAWDHDGRVRLIGLIGGGEDLPGFADPECQQELKSAPVSGIEKCASKAWSGGGDSG